MDYEEQCSSGCDSGWTLYLEEQSSSLSPHCDYFQGRRRRNVDCFRQPKRLKEDQDLEDLSMVSDASSGPPLHFNEDDEEEEEEGGDGEGGNHTAGCFYHTENHTSLTGEKGTRENRRLKVKDLSSLLDDTASSPFLDFSTKQKETRQEHAMEYSQGFSSTQFQVRAPYPKDFCDFFLSSPSGSPLQQDQGWFEGKNYW